ncbi:MAG: single-stranded DNA-binding protein [Chloroflexi bacterium]|nr:single-stranded DNA-binding protein [Chloroflexota bacterium]
MYQKIVLVGNLGNDPEMRYTPQGTPVTRLSVATSRKYNTADGQQKEETAWFRVSVFGKQAEACNQYLSKGRQVLVEGHLTADENGGPRLWTGQDGKPRASFEVFAETVRFLGSKREGGAPASTGSTEVVAPEPAAGEDLPF